MRLFIDDVELVNAATNNVLYATFGLWFGAYFYGDLK